MSEATRKWIRQLKSVSTMVQGDVVALVLALMVVVITSLFLLLWSLRQFDRRVILFVGISDSGKTWLFQKLTSESPRPTVASLVENEHKMVLEGSKAEWTVIDVPGNEKVRMTCVSKYASNCRHILFLVDAATLYERLDEVCKFLRELIVHPTVGRSSIPVSVILNCKDKGVITKDLVSASKQLIVDTLLSSKRGKLLKGDEETIAKEKMRLERFCSTISVSTLEPDLKKQLSSILLSY